MTTYMLNTLRAQGFDLTERSGHVGCSQCDALVINDVACHEHGCPNQTHECRGCSAQVERGVRYCEDCR